MKKWLALLSLISVLSFMTAITAFADPPNSTIRSFQPTSLIKNDGTYWRWGGNQSVPTQVYGLTEVKEAFDDQLYVKNDNTVWHWEASSASAVARVQQVKELNGLTQVYSDGAMSLALDAGGSVFVLAKSEYKLDISKITKLAGIGNVAKISSYYGTGSTPESNKRQWIFLKKDGTVWKSSDDLQTFDAIKPLEKIVDIRLNLALKEDGTVWTWPKEGQEVAASAVQNLSNIVRLSGNNYTVLAIDDQSNLTFWGSTMTGFSDSTTFHEQAPLKLTSIGDVKDAFIVERSIIVLTHDGKVYETSINLEKLPANPIFHLLASNAVQIKAGPRHVIIQKKDGYLMGWGINKTAELGNGDYVFMQRTPVSVQKPVTLELNGKPVPLTNGVIIRDNQAFVPLRSVFEQLGAKLTWNSANKVVTLERPSTEGASLTITINFNTNVTMLNQKPVMLKTVPFNINGTSYLPLRFISEQLGAKVDWFQKDDRISITLN